MAALYGRLQGNRGEVTRMGHAEITSKLETWHGSVRTTLHKDGSLEVEMGGKHGPYTTVFVGNVDTGDFTMIDPES